jgi:hypothetical protein
MVAHSRTQRPLPGIRRSSAAARPRPSQHEVDVYFPATAQEYIDGSAAPQCSMLMFEYASTSQRRRGHRGRHRCSLCRRGARSPD